FQQADLLLEHSRDAVPGEIDPSASDAEFLGDFLDRPLLEETKIKYLILFRADPTLDLSNGRFQQMAFPFLFPDRVQVQAGGVGNPFDGGRASGSAVGLAKANYL